MLESAILVFFSCKSQKLAVAYLNQEKYIKRILEECKSAFKVGELRLKIAWEILNENGINLTAVGM